jgi:hypothetical protein
MIPKLKHKRHFIGRFWLSTGILLFPLILPAQNCEFTYATGDVKGRNHVGGLIGRISGSEETVSNSYARGSVTGDTYAGGLTGSNEGNIINCYATGKVTGSASKGGLAGGGSGTVTGSYWDTQTTAQNTSAGGTGRNSDPMIFPYASDTYTGWDFTSPWKADVAPFQNGGYPLLTAGDVFRVAVQVYPPGSGTVSGDGYYLSGQQAQLQAAAKQKFAFKGWMSQTGLISTQLLFALKVTGDHSLIARFENIATSIIPGLPASKTLCKLYPNPVKNFLRIDFSAVNIEFDSFTIVDISGQIIKAIVPGRETNGQFSIDVTGLTPGIYFFLARHRDGYFSERFVKY